MKKVIINLVPTTLLSGVNVTNRDSFSATSEDNHVNMTKLRLSNFFRELTDFKRILILSCLLLFYGFTIGAIPTITSVVGTNGDCAYGKVTANVTGITGLASYFVVNSNGQRIPAQSLNISPGSKPNSYIVIFPGLESEVYIFETYDATTQQYDPVISDTVRITNSDVPQLELISCIANTTTEICDLPKHNGTLTISYTGGKGTSHIKIKSSSYNDEIDTDDQSYTFINLPPGDYFVEVEGGCNQSVNSNGTIEVKNNYYGLIGSTFTNIRLTQTSTSTHVHGDIAKDSCNILKMSIDYLNLFIEINGNSEINPDYKFWDWGIMIEYPLNTYNHWQPFGNSHTTTYRLDNYDSETIKYRIHAKHPCTGDTIISEIYTLPSDSEFYAFADNTGSCSSKPTVSVDITRPPYESVVQGYSNRAIWGHLCNDGPFWASLWQGSTLISKKELNGTRATFSDELVAGEYYEILVESADGWSQKIRDYWVLEGTDNWIKKTDSVLVPAPTPLSKKMTIETHATSWPVVPGIMGNNYNQCDPETTSIAISTKSDYLTSDSITFTIKGKTSSFEQTKTLFDGTGILANNILWGSYEIVANYGCGPDTLPSLQLIRPIDGFGVDFLGYEKKEVCDGYIMKWKWFAHLNGDTIVEEDIYHYYNNRRFCGYMLIVDAPNPILIGTRIEMQSGHISIMEDNLPGGKYLSGGIYKLVFYPYSAPVSPKTINGKSIDYPTIECVEERTMILPEYVPFQLNSRPGGIACDGSANVTVITSGGASSLQYELKKEGASDDTYTEPQSDNVFYNQSPGNYQLRISDGCMAEVHNISVFDRTDQFVSMSDEVVCENRDITLYVSSIGPAISYEWGYSATSPNGPWTSIGNNAPTLTIPSVGKGDIG